MKKIVIAILIMLWVWQVNANVAEQQIRETLKAANTHAMQHSVSPLIKDLQDNYFFVVFFRSTCPHCHRFVPILKSFTKTYHVPLVAYSVDGSDLDNLGAHKMTGQEYKNYFLQGGFKAVVPALYLQNRITNQVYPVLFGEAKAYQLAKRVNQLMQDIKAQEHE
jgi:type-F conjugative transfer system pilin assembly thiol-disulfide isomerase TrbB